MIDEADYGTAVVGAAGRLGALGFRARATGPFAIRLSRGDVWVAFTYGDAGTRELAIEIGHRDASDPLDLPEALRGSSCPPGALENIAPLQTSSAKVLERLAGRAVDLLCDHVGGLLLGEPRAWAKALTLGHRPELAAAVPDLGLDDSGAFDLDTIETSDAAWLARDYRQVCALLGPVRDTLDNVHHRRLHFAERRA